MVAIYFSRNAALNAVLVNQNFTEFEDGRRYYTYEGALIICRNDLVLPNLQNCIVDAQTGYDLTVVGFTLDERQIGQWRPKITVYRKLQEGWKPSAAPVERPISSMWNELRKKKKSPQGGYGGL